ncbi:MAG: hypothetical protein R2697_16040 [Ilumatobacteraceae bacterium]
MSTSVEPGFFDEQEAALHILWGWSSAEIDGDVEAVAAAREAADILRHATERYRDRA